MLHPPLSSPRKLMHGGDTHTDRPSLREGDPSAAEPPFMPKREKLSGIHRS